MSLDINIPSPEDPKAVEKILGILKMIREEQERQSKNFPPVQQPIDGNQTGDVYFDQTDGKLKVFTDQGLKILKFE